MAFFFAADRMRALADAVRFLTILPVPGRGAVDGPAAARAVAGYPAAGALVGGAGAAAGWLALWLFGPPVHAVAVVAAWAVVTGGLHLDGVADTCDAVLSWRSRERKLEILRDSRIGAMGALGLGLALLLLAAALSALGRQWWVGALAAPVWGRWAAAYGIVRFPPARGEGLGASVCQHAGARHLVAATAVAAAAIAALGASGAAGGEVLLAALPVWLLTEVLGRRLAASLGGLTGDTYGALCVAGETATLLFLAAWHRHPAAAGALARCLGGP